MIEAKPLRDLLHGGEHREKERCISEFDCHERLYVALGEDDDVNLRFWIGMVDR
jgi:hypothetical protein